MSDLAGGSNIDDVEKWEKDLIDGFDFTRVGEEQSLGRDMVRDVAQGIHDRTVAERRDATGAPVKSNEYHYAVWKAEKLGVYQPLIKTGRMLSLVSLIGNPEISPDLIVMPYGTGEEDEDGVTDRDKAGYVSGERPFFALDDAIVDRLADRAGEAFDKLIQEHS